ncbi:uncharacterized protein LOC122818834 [Drosophila biarmipes]|uniref:uncharacterized protein LOC122818834 n=1 Tax=Drosophila biarmipes TaxID=125945 RepID=UPI001CDAB8B5|nr:uncharacterized protein LOC122818834 [Drosophila biarmipes]
MYFGAVLLIEEHDLGERKVQEYQSQVPPIFEAIIRSFKKRLAKNRLNLPASQIAAFMQFLDGIAVHVGGMPKDKDHRRFVKDYYADLDFEEGDNFSILLLKINMLRTRRLLEKIDYPVSSHPNTLDIPNAVDFNLPYAALAEPSFMTRGHDVFKFNGIGVFLASQVFAAFHNLDADYNCQDFTVFLRSLDDLDLFTNKEVLCADDPSITIEDLDKLDIVLLSLVHDAYFSAGSGFDQAQPFFTNVPLKELFFLQFGQRFLHDFIFSRRNSGFNGILPTLPAFAEAFNCSSSFLQT